jgi:hypothetical protein
MTIDSLFFALLVFSAVVSFFAPHFFQNFGVLTFARYAPVEPDALAILNILGYLWNGFLSLLALMIFNIPGLQVVSVIYDALAAWVTIRFIRG